MIARVSYLSPNGVVTGRIIQIPKDLPEKDYDNYVIQMAREYKIYPSFRSIDVEYIYKLSTLRV